MENNIIKILLVEDNTGDARLLQEIFRDGKSNTYEITQADKVSEAAKYLEEQEFDVALSV